MSGGRFEPHLVNSVALFVDYFSPVLGAAHDPRGLGALGPGVMKPDSGLCLAMAHSVGLGLAFPCLGLSFLTCHGSRLGCIGKHPQEYPGEQAGEIRRVVDLWEGAYGDLGARSV